MPRHTTMWLVAGGAALASAALTYVVTRPGLQPAVGGLRNVRRRLHETGLMVSRRAMTAMAARGVAGECVSSSTEPPVHNRAFEDYREATLRRLNEDERAFQDFLEQLRHARDRAEFDRFMADRRHPPAATAL